jgi:hypothetical protein
MCGDFTGLIRGAYRHATTRFCQSDDGGIGDRYDNVRATISDASGTFCAARYADGAWTCAMDAWAHGGEPATDRVDSS